MRERLAMEAYTAHLEREQKKWARVVKERGIKAE